MRTACVNDAHTNVRGSYSPRERERTIRPLRKAKCRAVCVPHRFSAHAMMYECCMYVCMRARGAAAAAAAALFRKSPGERRCCCACTALVHTRDSRGNYRAPRERERESDARLHAPSDESLCVCVCIGVSELHCTRTFGERVTHTVYTIYSLAQYRTITHNRVVPLSNRLFRIAHQGVYARLAKKKNVETSSPSLFQRTRTHTRAPVARDVYNRNTRTGMQPEEPRERASERGGR